MERACQSSSMKFHTKTELLSDCNNLHDWYYSDRFGHGWYGIEYYYYIVRCNQQISRL